MLAQVWEAACVYRWLVCGVTLAVLALAVVYTRVWPPVYTTRALLMIESDKDVARDEFYVNWNIFRKEDARTELQLLDSGPVLNEVIEREQLTFDDVYHPLGSQLKYFWETSWVGTQYQSLKDRLFPQPENPFVTEGDKQRGKILDDLAAAVQVIPVGESNVGELRVRGPSPRVADVANTLVRVYQEMRLARFRDEATRALETLSAEETSTRAQVEAVERERAAYLGTHGVDFAQLRDVNRLEQLATLEADIVKMREAITSAEAGLAEVERQLTAQAENRLVASVEELNTLRRTAESEKLSLELALARAMAQYREDSREVQEIRANMARVDEIIARGPEYVESGRTTGANALREELLSRKGSLETSLASSRAGLGVLEAQAAELETRIASLPGIQLGLTEIDRRLGLLQQRHQVLSLKRAQAEVSLATVESVMPSLRLVGPARYPGSKSWPTMKIVLPAALVLGVGLGAFAAVVRHHVAGRVRGADLARLAEDAPVFGRVRVPTRGLPVIVKPVVVEARGERAGAGRTS